MQPNQLCLAITGSFGAKDIGDEAMLTEDLHHLVEVIGVPRENLYLIGWNREYIARYHNHPIGNCFTSQDLELAYSRGGLHRPKVAIKQRRKRKALQPIWDALERCHGVLVTGGGTINSRDAAGGSVHRMFHMVKAFHAQNLPIFMSGQTIGPLGRYPKHDAMAKSIVETVDFLSVRDSHYSNRYLDLIEAKPKELLQTFDDAYTLPYEDETLPQDVEDHVQARDCIAINITDYTSDTDEKRFFMAELCERLIDTYDVNLVFVSHSPADLFSLWTIRDAITNQSKDRVLVPDTREWHDKTIKKMISRCRCAVGGRYHFIVFAGTSDTPFVGMAGNHYSYIKQDGFARVLDQHRYVLTERETWDWNILMSRIDERMNMSLDLRDRFQRPSDSMQRLHAWLAQRFGVETGVHA